MALGDSGKGLLKEKFSQRQLITSRRTWKTVGLSIFDQQEAELADKGTFEEVAS